jgi:hypothetical protein
MPLYEYECECGWKAERLLTVTKDGKLRCSETGREVGGCWVRCPVCKGVAPKVDHPGGAFHLRGGDWPSKTFKGGY